MPASKPSFDESTVKPCLDLAQKWQSWNQSFSPPKTEDFKSLKTLQKLVYLSTLLEGKPLTNSTLEKMDEVHKFDEEIYAVRTLWHSITAKNQYDKSFDKIMKFLKDKAPIKPNLVVPLFRELLAWDEKNKQVMKMMKGVKNADYFLKLVKTY